MPELPEVETTCRGIAPFVVGKTVTGVTVRQRQLRWPVTRGLQQKLVHRRVLQLQRRAKYILFRFEHGCLLLHLGMSGSLRIVAGNQAPEKHDHIDIEFTPGIRLRFRDPRRFGSLLWTAGDPLQHPLLAGLGPEPLNDDFNGNYLYQKARGRTQAIKTFIMDSRIVVGVGNIYASESLFGSGIHPKRAAGRLSRERCERLAAAIKQVLKQAIAAGGTTLRDFASGDGRPGYFYLKLKVYDRALAPCPRCGNPIRQARIGQRSAFYCVNCQR